MKAFIRILIVVIILGAAYYFISGTEAGAKLRAAMPWSDGASAGTSAAAEAIPTGAPTSEAPSDIGTVQIRSADSILGEVSASGNIDLESLRSVAAKVAGDVNDIVVRPGDVVAKGDVLIILDSSDLERAANQAELDVQSAKNDLDQIKEPADDADIASAQADLAEAKENLTDVQAGPSKEELAAARASLLSAQAKYDDLLKGPSDAELIQLQADMRRNEIALRKAQGDYDQIAWRNDSSMTTEAETLQTATIDYETAQAAYAEATQPASTADLAEAQSGIQDAQVSLDDLLNSPTAAEIAQAEAQVAQAEAALAQLQIGPSEMDLASAEIALEKSILDLEEAYSNLALAQVTAPAAGTILTVSPALGESIGAGGVVATMADISQLQLTIDVAEIDIANVKPGQPASIAIDAFPQRTFTGVVDYIAPSSASDSDLVNYAVTIALDRDRLEGVLPGMTAVAMLQNTTADLNNAWLVPSNSVQQSNGASTVVRLQNGVQEPVPVQITGIEGEWVVVVSPDLQAGDSVVGSVTTFVGQNSGFGGMRMPGVGGGRPPGSGGRP